MCFYLRIAQICVRLDSNSFRFILKWKKLKEKYKFVERTEYLMIYFLSQFWFVVWQSKWNFFFSLRYYESLKKKTKRNDKNVWIKAIDRQFYPHFVCICVSKRQIQWEKWDKSEFYWLRWNGVKARKAFGLHGENTNTHTHATTTDRHFECFSIHKAKNFFNFFPPHRRDISMCVSV